jgi:hypothetical protein
MTNKIFWSYADVINLLGKNKYRKKNKALIYARTEVHGLLAQQ